jgi:transmembrane sensor
MTSASEIEAQAAEWLIRLDALGGAEDASPDFQRWSDADPRHRVAYLRLRTAWRKADSLAHSGKLLGLSAPSGAAVPPWRAWRWPLGMAAAILIAVGAIVWALASQAVWRTYSTDIGGFERVVLADGSNVELNTNTEIRVRVAASVRQVVLVRGQAHFKVAHDSRRPFDVMARSTTIRAVGTAFSVTLRSQEQVEVLVSEGRVSIASTDLESTPTLSAGEAAIVKPSRLALQSVAVRPSEMARRLSWRDGTLAFDGETLAQAVAEFNRYNRRQITIADPAIANLRIGGSFEATDPQSFVNALEHSFGVRAAVSAADVVVLEASK